MDGLDIKVDRTIPVPLHQQVADQIETAIASGQLASGQRIETEVALAEQLGLSRPTVGQAIRALVNKGLLVRRRGVGTLVMGGQVHRSMELTSLYDDLEGSGHQPSTRVLHAELVLPDADVSTELGTVPGEEVWSLERVRSIGSRPLALMVNYLPKDLVDIGRLDLEAGGLYSALREAGIQPSIARQRIGCRRATTREAGLLNEDQGRRFSRCMARHSTGQGGPSNAAGMPTAPTSTHST